MNKKIRFKELRAYFCPKCNLFHLTSTPDIQCLIQEIEKLKQENIYLNEIKHKQYSQIGQLKESHLIEQLRKKDEIIKQLKKDIREVIQKLISSKT